MRTLVWKKNYQNNINSIKIEARVNIKLMVKLMWRNGGNIGDLQKNIFLDNQQFKNEQLIF